MFFKKKVGTGVRGQRRGKDGRERERERLKSIFSLSLFFQSLLLNPTILQKGPVTIFASSKNIMQPDN